MNVAITIDDVQPEALISGTEAGPASKRIVVGFGFWIFLLSNALWIVWAVGDHAYALIFLQVCLAIMNIHGVRTNDTSAPATRADE